MESFRLAVVGAGRMGRTHLAAISGSPEVSVTGVVEPYPGEELAGSPVFGSLDQLLGSVDVDGALMAVPTDQHVAVLAEVMAAGLPVLCEKPCGLTSAEAQANADLAERTGLVLQIAYWRRFVPSLMGLRRQLIDGELGEILAVNCSQWDLAPPSEAFRNSSGGIFADMGVHEFDQIRWLTGQEFTSMHTARTSGADPDCAQIVAELDGGSTAMISLGRWHPAGDSVKVEVYGTKGTANDWFLHPVGGEAVFHQALRAQAEDFARLVRTGVGSGARAADAVAALRAAELASEGR
ncbi:MAG TPA: Gfo/Idh/MocA family oxidoreductase [Streptosporangiaceae bacterium]|nr:Gfo/Idh/MocA family oxidoreductase [Streptosporangiaceae bacterium]